MIERKIHALVRLGVGFTARNCADKVEEALEKLEEQGWRVSEGGFFTFEGWVFVRMWRETK